MQRLSIRAKRTKGLCPPPLGCPEPSHLLWCDVRKSEKAAKHQKMTNPNVLQDGRRRQVLPRHGAHCSQPTANNDFAAVQGTYNEYIRGGTIEWGAATHSPPDGLADLNSFKHCFISKDKQIKNLVNPWTRRAIWKHFFRIYVIWMEKVSHLTELQCPLEGFRTRWG